MIFSPRLPFSSFLSFFFSRACLFALLLTLALLTASCGGGGGGGNGASGTNSTAEDENSAYLPAKQLIPSEYRYAILTLDVEEHAGLHKSLTLELHNTPSTAPYEGSMLVTAQEGISPALAGVQGTWEHNEDNATDTLRLAKLRSPRSSSGGVFLELLHVEARMSAKQQQGDKLIFSGIWQSGSLLISEGGEALLEHAPEQGKNAGSVTVTLTYVR